MFSIIEKLVLKYSIYSKIILFTTLMFISPSDPLYIFWIGIKIFGLITSSQKLEESYDRGFSSTLLRVAEKQQRLQVLLYQQQDNMTCSTLWELLHSQHTGGSPQFMRKPWVRRAWPMRSQHRTTSSLGLMQKAVL